MSEDKERTLQQKLKNKTKIHSRPPTQGICIFYFIHLSI